MTRVLITGGAGFIGSHLARDCLRRGDQVTILTRAGSDPWRLADLRGRIRVEAVEPCDTRGLVHLVGQIRPQRVFHLAAATRIAERVAMTDLSHAMISNFEPLRTLIDALRRLDQPPKAVVRTGTLAEYGQAACIRQADSPERPDDAYGFSAVAGTHLLRMARLRLGLPAVTARLCLTYGGGQSGDFLIPDMIRKGLDGNSPRLRRPHARRDLIHVSDVVAALQLVADNAATMPPVVAVSTGQAVPMQAVAEIIAGLLAGRSPAPREIVDDPAEPQTLSCAPSPELLDLGWRPAVPLNKGLRDTVNWEVAARPATRKEMRA